MLSMCLHGHDSGGNKLHMRTLVTCAFAEAAGNGALQGRPIAVHQDRYQAKNVLRRVYWQPSVHEREEASQEVPALQIYGSFGWLGLFSLFNSFSYISINSSENLDPQDHF